MHWSLSQNVDVFQEEKRFEMEKLYIGDAWIWHYNYLGFDIARASSSEVFFLDTKENSVTGKDYVVYMAAHPCLELGKLQTDFA